MVDHEDFDRRVDRLKLRWIPQFQVNASNDGNHQSFSPAWSCQRLKDRRGGFLCVVPLRGTQVYGREFGKLPRPGWKNLKVVITGAFRRMYRRIGRESFVERMVPHGFSAAELAETPEKWVVMVRPSLIRDYVAKGVVPNENDVWCWSM